MILHSISHSYFQPAFLLNVDVIFIYSNAYHLDFQKGSVLLILKIKSLSGKDKLTLCKTPVNTKHGINKRPEIKASKKKKKSQLRHNYLIFLPFPLFCLLSWKVLVQEFQVFRDLGKVLGILFLFFFNFQHNHFVLKAGMQICRKIVGLLEL